MTMADQIAVMNGGRIEQLGTPTELYETPSTAFVAGFLGVSILIPGTVSGHDTVRLHSGPEVRVRADALAGRTGEVAVGIRPEKIELGEGQPERARRDGRRGSLRRGRNAVHRRDRVRQTHRVPAECVAGIERRRAGPKTHAQLEPRFHVRRRLTGGIRMTDVLNRRQLLRRAAAGGAFLTVPGVLAACGGPTKKSPATNVSKTLAKTLRFSNWTLYIDVNEKTKRHPTLDAFKKKTGTAVQYTEDINDNATYFGKIQGPLSRGQSIDRDIIVMTDNSRYPSLLVKKGWVREARQERDPEHQEPRAQPPTPRVGSQPRLQPSVAVGPDRDRLQRQAHRPGDSRLPTCSRIRS